MFKLKQAGKCLFVVLMVFVSVGTCVAQVESGQLARLRQQLALYYLEPAPHMELAKYYRDGGDRLQAFYLLEYARRARFPEAQFDQAFRQSFRIRGLTDADRDGEEVYNEAIEMHRQGKLKQAEELFVKAAEMAPRSAHVQMWVGRFFFKSKQDNERALHYYLNAYFLDPHAYESEFVESRIRKINGAAAATRFRQLTQSGVSLVKMLNDSNPVVVSLTLEQMSAQWRPAYLKPVLSMLEHDDEGVRWQAMGAIGNHANASFDATLEALLKDADLRKRGLAAYLAAHLWKQRSFSVLRGMLREEAQLLRFDAISALILSGGNEGRLIVLEHRGQESHPTLKRLIDRPVNSP